MTWTTFHRRGEVLRTVIDAADARRDGLLPMDLPGVPETFGDELTLLGALQLRWYTRLSGQLERALMHQPLDTDEAAVAAWRATADELPGLRMVLEHYRAEPLDDRMAAALATSEGKERVMLAAMAGRAGATTEATASAGRVLEERAKARVAA
ncbi:hypothetical protein [Nocardioides sp.]|uniref:hypothetical protein n=1 Tax=Nocardioides sp. TaxID=35761 RepID=UPI002F3F0A01